MPDPVRADLRVLLDQTGWVRSLARGLLGDDHLADDAMQESFRVAIERAPRDGRPIVRWFTAVVRNFARQEHRSRARRESRERECARPEMEAAGADALERLELHKVLVDAVHSLDEPYRTVILLRYFDGLAPPAIAERTGVPVRTVHTRLTRALGRLRAELERAKDHDRTWMASLAAFARVPRVSGPALGVMVMNAKLKWALAVAVLGLIAVPLCWTELEPPPPPSLAAPPPPAATPLVLSEELEPARSLAAPSIAAEPRREIDARPPPAPAIVSIKPRIACRVLDVDGAPLAGMHVCFATERDRGIALGEPTGSDGRTEIDDPGRSGALTAMETRYVAVLSPDVYDGTPLRAIVVAERQPISGVVLDAARVPLPGARVSVRMADGFRSRFDHRLDMVTMASFEAATDAQGRFELVNAPRVRGAFVAASRAGFEEEAVPLPDLSDLAMEIVLVPLAKEQLLRGLVVDAGGAPVLEAWVGSGERSTKSDADGRFVLTLENSGVVDHVTAVKRGFLPATIARASSEGAWPDPLVLKLGGPPLVIRGRVLDEHGEPVARAFVWTDDETRFGPVELAGFEMSLWFDRTLEDVLRESTEESRARADDDGRFELTGLLPAAYRVSAYDERTLAFAETAPVPAGGPDVSIRLPREERHAKIAGRLLSLSGAPVEWVEVSLSRDVARTEPRADQDSEFEISGERVQTDADGRFSFTNVVRGVNSLDVNSSPTTQDAHFALDASMDLEHLEFRIARRCHFRVDLDRWRDRADSFEIRDARDAVLRVMIFHGSIGWREARMPLIDGRSEPASTSDDATTIVLYREDLEVGRLPVKLTPGELNVIRP